MTAAPTETSILRPRSTADHQAEQDVVIYDGHCRICTAQIERLARWDRHGRLSFLSLHDRVVAERYPDLAHDALMREMYIIDPRGGRHAGAAALRYLSRRVPRLWWLSPFLHLPGTLGLWQRVYGALARVRYRFGRVDTCDDGACQVHFKK